MCACQTTLAIEITLCRGNRLSLLLYHSTLNGYLKSLDERDATFHVEEDLLQTWNFFKMLYSKFSRNTLLQCQYWGRCVQGSPCTLASNYRSCFMGFSVAHLFIIISSRFSRYVQLIVCKYYCFYKLSILHIFILSYKEDKPDIHSILKRLSTLTSCTW